MKVKWLGHASFMITSEDGTSIITDPYAAYSGLNYGEIKESADIVTISHEHGDHNNAAAIQGNPEVVKGTAPVEVKGIKINGIATYHDDANGSQRGGNTIFCMDIDGMRVCHLGDLGHQLGDKEVAEIGKTDIVFTPVGGFFTIDAKTATQVCNQLGPKVIIPMHFKNDKCAFPIAAVDDFLQGKTAVSHAGASEVEYNKEGLPASAQIVVLQPAL